MEQADDQTTLRYAVEDLVSGRPLIRSTTFEQAARIVREISSCWPEAEDEIVIMPVSSSLLPH